MKDEDLDAILERGRERTKLLDEKFQQDDKGDMLDFKLDGGQYTQTFEGVNYAQRQKQDLDALKTARRRSQPLEGPGERKKSAYNAQAVLNAQEYQAEEAAKKEIPSRPSIACRGSTTGRFWTWLGCRRSGSWRLKVLRHCYQIRRSTRK